ncbi:camp-dependent protein kinase regulatory chain, putative, partial [Bodo saltans]
MPHRTAIHFLKKEHESTVLPLPPTVAQPQNGAPPRLGFATTTTTTTTAMVNNSSSDFTATNGSSGDVIGTDSKRSNEFLQFSILGNTFSDTGSDADENNNSHREQQRGTTKRHTTKRHHHQPFRDDDDEDDYDEPTSLCELSVADGIPLTSSKSFSSPNTKLGVSFHSTSSPIKRVGTGRLQPGGGNSNNNVSASFNMEDSTSNVTLVHRLQSSRGAFASINLPNLSINNVARGSSAHAHTTNSHQHHARHTMSKRGDSSEDILGSLDLDNPLPMSASQRGGVGSSTSGGGLQKVSSGSELFSEDVSEVDDDDGVTVAEQTPAAQALILNSPGQAGGFASHAPSASASKSAEPSFELPSFLTNASLGLSFSSLVPPQVPSQPPPNLRSPLAANSAAKMPPGLHSSLRVTIPPSIANNTTSATATVISPRALQNSSANSNSSNARTPQRQRHLEQHKQRLEGSHQKLDASMARQHQAQERRQFLSDHQNLRQGASWAVMLCIAARTHRFLHCARVLAAQKRRMIRNGGKLVFPSVMVGVRRALRRARTRLLVHQHQYERPPLASLRNDKILGLFPDDVLRCATRSMAIRYFFPNEAIVFMGCEDDEAYVLASGSADVMMGATKVFTMQPGMVFGTIGMISGEPRSASIFARGEGVMAWVMKRAVFDAAGDSAAIDAAHEALAEVRQKNIMNVYKSRLDPVALSAFPLFHGLAHETLQGLIVGAVSRVVRKNTVLADPTQPISAVSHLLLLKGKITLSFKEPPPRLVHSDSVFDTVSELRNTLDVPPKLLSKRLSMLFGTRRCEKTNRLAHDLEHEVCAPALLNVNSLFLPGGMMRPTPFVITAATDCDLLSLSRRTLRGQDVLELAAIQQNALNAHADFLGAPTKREVATMLLDSIAPLFSVMPSA